jgi:asparagine N-glycosylation enzyme membrane subunit Stt3
MELLAASGLGVAAAVAAAARSASVWQHGELLPSRGSGPYTNLRAARIVGREGAWGYISGHDFEAFVPHGRPNVAVGDPVVVLVGAAVHAAVDAIVPGAVTLETVAALLPVVAAVLTVALAATLARSSSGGAAPALSAVLAAWLLALAPGHVACTSAGSFDGEAAAPLLVALAVYAWGSAVRGGVTGSHSRATSPSASASAAAAAAACWNWTLAMAWGPSGVVLAVVACHCLALAASGQFTARAASSLGVFVAVTVTLLVATSAAAPTVALDRVGSDLLPWQLGSAATATRMDARRQAMAWSSLFYDLHIMALLIPAALLRCFWGSSSSSTSGSSKSGGVDDVLVAVWAMVTLAYAAGSIRCVPSIPFSRSFVSLWCDRHTVGVHIARLFIHFLPSCW